MPVEGRTTELEPVATPTTCLCKHNGIRKIHDPETCIHMEREPKKPAPYAGQRAWKRYYKLTKEQKKG